MDTYVFVAEKKDIIDHVKPVYQKIQNQLPYKIVAWIPLAGHILAYKDKDNKKWAWENLPFFPDDMKKYNFDKMSPENPKEYYEFIPKKNSKGRIDDLKNAIKKYNPTYILNAGDSDGAGSILARQAISYCNVPLSKEKRFWASDMSEKGVTKALKGLILPINHKFADGSTMLHIYQAAALRIILDKTYGYSYSEAVSLKANSTIPLGRVKGPVLSIISKRELENKNFKPKTYYTITANFEAPEGKYTGELYIDNKLAKFDSKTEAEKIIKGLAETAKISKIEQKTSYSTAPRLNKTVDMEKKMSEMCLAKKSKETDTALEGLYLPPKGSGKPAIMTYPRTDSQYLEEGTVKDFPEILDACACVPSLKKYVDQIKKQPDVIAAVGKNKNYVNSKKSASHEALHLTGVKFDFNKLSPLEKGIVTEAASSFVKLFLPKKKTANTDIYTENNKNIFKTHGSVVLDPGWSILNNTKSKDKELPQVKENEEVKDAKNEVNEKQTTPPPFYSEASLLSVMDNVNTLMDNKDTKSRLKSGLRIGDREQIAKGIGTPATRTSILEGLKKSGLIEIKKRKYHATEKGLKIYQAIKDLDIASPMLTADMEDKMNQIMLGNLSADDYRKHLFDYLTKQMQVIKASTKIPDLSTLDAKNGKAHYHVEESDFTYNGHPLKKITGGKYGAFYAEETGDPKKKGLSFSATVGGHEFTADEVNDLLAKKTLKDVKMKTRKGEPLTANINIDFKNNKLNITRTDIKDLGITYKGHKILRLPSKSGNFYAEQTGTKKRGLTFFGEPGNHVLTKDEIETLLQGKTLKDVELTKKDGSKTKASLSLDLKTGNFHIVKAGVVDSGIKYKGQPVMIYPGQHGRFYTVKSGNHWISVSETEFGYKFTRDEVAQLYAGNILKNIQMTFSNGPQTVEEVSLNLTGKNIGKLNFKFAPRGEEMSITINGKHVRKATSKKGSPYYLWDDHYLPTHFSSHKYTEQEIKDLYSGKPISVSYTSSKGNDLTSKIKYNLKTNEVEFVKD